MTALPKTENKKIPGLRSSYPWLHWSLTLLTTPVLISVLNLLFLQEEKPMLPLLGLYPIMVVMGVIFSIPALIVYLLIFWLLDEISVDWKVAKLIMISFTLLGIFLIMKIMGGSAANEFFLSYAGTALLIGLLLKIKAKDNF